MANKNSKKYQKRILRLGILLVSLFICGYIIWIILKGMFGMIINPNQVSYLTNTSDYNINLYNNNFKIVDSVPRGLKVIVNNKNKEENNNKLFYMIKINNKDYYVANENIVKDKKDIISEDKVYVRTSINLLDNIKDTKLGRLVLKGEELKVLSYDKINDKGIVNVYKVSNGKDEGYIYGKYVVLNKESSLLNYDQNNSYLIHSKRLNAHGGGAAGNLDYYPVDKKVFKDNIMPDPVYALYLTSSSATINNIDKYIELVKDTKINAFVVDIKDNQVPGYKSLVMKKYSITNYNRANNSVEAYRAAIKKLKDAGFYVIGRITVFKDYYYALDHPENTILDTRTNQPFMHGNTYWPSPFQRDVWEFNVELAKEAVREMKFNEIQFDYIRFPDRTNTFESAGYMNFRNTYNEEKAQAVQRFLMYATDQLHQLKVYVSGDVFGESAHTYVTAYGQYFPAMSNVLDVISAMPYPDHFSKFEYGFKEVVWTVPYQILNHWGSKYAIKRQGEIPSPAKVRTWIQAYDTIREPFIKYNAKEVEDQIKGLFDAGLNNGYMTWNSSSNIEKYRAQLSAYSKNYK
jgi:hypothetical protein